MTKNRLNAVLRTLVSITLIVVLLYIMRGKYGQIWSAVTNADMRWLVISLVTFQIALSIASIRLFMIVKTQCETRLRYFEAVSLTYLGYFFNNFLPTSIGGDVVKAYYLAKKTGRRSNTYTAVFVDRAIGLFTMIFMAFFALFFVPNNIVTKDIRYVLYAFTAVTVLMIIFLTNKTVARKFSLILRLVKPVEDKLKRIYNNVHSYRANKTLVLKSFLISVASQLSFFVSISMLAASIGARISMMDVLLLMPVICMMSMLPSINGLGLREGATVLLFGPLIGKTNAFAVGVLWFFLLLITSVIGGLIYGLSKQFRFNIKEIEKSGGAI